MGLQKPRTGTDLARELAPICLGRPLLEGPGEDLAFVQGGVRTWLAEQVCERGTGQLPTQLRRLLPDAATCAGRVSGLVRGEDKEEVVTHCHATSTSSSAVALRPAPVVRADRAGDRGEAESLSRTSLGVRASSRDAAR